MQHTRSLSAALPAAVLDIGSRSTFIRRTDDHLAHRIESMPPWER